MLGRACLVHRPYCGSASCWGVVAPRLGRTLCASTVTFAPRPDDGVDHAQCIFILRRVELPVPERLTREPAPLTPLGPFRERSIHLTRSAS